MRVALAGATILLTGASAGLGREMARRLTTAKTLVLVARRKDRLDELATELLVKNPALQVLTRECDLQDPTALEGLISWVDSEVGAIDVLINNAGFGSVGLFERRSWKSADGMVQLNVRALCRLTHHFVQGMIQRSRGGILNVSSGFGLEFMPGLAVYIGTKHFVTGFTDSLRVETAGTGVVISQLCPGPVATEFLETAGTSFIHPLVKVFQVSAADCCQTALAGFAAGKAMIVPGVLIKLLRWLGRVSPRVLKRLIYRPMARMMRRA